MSIINLSKMDFFPPPMYPKLCQASHKMKKTTTSAPTEVNEFYTVSVRAISTEKRNNRKQNTCSINKYINPGDYIACVLKTEVSFRLKYKSNKNYTIMV